MHKHTLRNRHRITDRVPQAEAQRQAQTHGMEEHVHIHRQSTGINASTNMGICRDTGTWHTVQTLTDATPHLPHQSSLSLLNESGMYGNAVAHAETEEEAALAVSYNPSNEWLGINPADIQPDPSGEGLIYRGDLLPHPLPPCTDPRPDEFYAQLVPLPPHTWLFCLLAP